MKYLVLVISLLLEAIFSNIVSLNSLFIPLFLITSLVIIYPYFCKKNINFFLVCLISGFLYDLIFADSLFINTLSFSFAGIIIILGYSYVNYSIYSSNILNIIVIILYRIISYLLLCIIGYTTFNENILLSGISSSLILNIIYGLILYLVIDMISKIFVIKRA